MPGIPENKMSKKGEAKANGGAGRGSIESMEHYTGGKSSEKHVGSTCGGGIKFGMQEVNSHPDKSAVRSPENDGKKDIR